jgi:stringent starvation protein B
MVPITNVIAIYARENGQGMAFPMSLSPASMAGPAEAGEPTIDKPESPLALPAPNVPAAVQRHAEGTDKQIMQLVPESHHTADGEDRTDPPDPPSSTPRSRPPPLKRVK